MITLEVVNKKTYKGRLNNPPWMNHGHHVQSFICEDITDKLGDPYILVTPASTTDDQKHLINNHNQDSTETTGEMLLSEDMKGGITPPHPMEEHHQC